LVPTKIKNSKTKKPEKTGQESFERETNWGTGKDGGKAGGAIPRANQCRDRGTENCGKQGERTKRKAQNSGAQGGKEDRRREGKGVPSRTHQSPGCGKRGRSGVAKSKKKKQLKNDR